MTARVPVKVKTQDILEAFFALARDPTLAYAISGHVRLSGAESGSRSGEESVPFDEDGEFRLPIGASGACISWPTSKAALAGSAMASSNRVPSRRLIIFSARNRRN